MRARSLSSGACSSRLRFGILPSMGSGSHGRVQRINVFTCDDLPRGIAALTRRRLGVGVPRQ